MSLSWDRAWEKEQKRRKNRLTKQGRGESTEEERKRGRREDEDNCDGSGRKVVQLPVKSQVLVNGSCKAKVVIRFSSKGQSWNFAWSSPCQPWKEHYTKRLHSSYLPPCSASPLPGLVDTLIIQDVHLCSCHLGCSLWSEKQLTGKCQTLGCLGHEWCLERRVPSLCVHFNGPRIQFALTESDTYARRE